MSDDLSDGQRRELFRELDEAAARAGVTDFDAETRAVGHLAGPASPDRPDVPVWEYLDYVASHPETSIDQLSRIRFPISFYGGGSTVASIADHTAQGPVPATYIVTSEDVVLLFALMHEAGALRWNAATRTIEELKPRELYAPAIYEQWRHRLEQRLP